MSDLDKKLETICESFYNGMPASHRQGALQAIKQAFIDDEWKPLTEVTPEGVGMQAASAYGELMTSQEWLEKFQKEIPTWSKGDRTALRFERTYLEAAKRVAGVQ
jgi:hypothetical protein